MSFKDLPVLRDLLRQAHRDVIIRPSETQAESVQVTSRQPQSSYAHQGMPAMDSSGRSTSFFEFWPTWVMYIPVALQWTVLALRYRSLTLPLIANPSIPLSGMVGVPKSAVFEQAGKHARSWILPWSDYLVSDEPVENQMRTVLRQLERDSLNLPIVGKPNIGCRGVGVKLLRTESDLHSYLTQYPAQATIQFQQLAPWEAEAGVFYIRYPGHKQGRITSLTLKYMPYVIGDGVSTLAELVAADPRAGQLQHLYRDRHQGNWLTVIEKDLPFRLIFAASHSRGAVFRDGNKYITEALTQRLDSLFDDIPGFHYGRLDVKFRDLDSLMQGDSFAIIEINGASAESIHIWDRNAVLGTAIKTLLFQYKTLFALGHANRSLGFQPPAVAELWRAWRLESALVKKYPRND